MQTLFVPCFELANGLACHSSTPWKSVEYICVEWSGYLYMCNNGRAGFSLFEKKSTLVSTH